jgi:hypothetical protein
MIITLQSDFHMSKVSVRVPALPATLSPTQTQRVDRELCGVSGCQCGGLRGTQFHGTALLTWDVEYVAGDKPGCAKRVYTIRERGAA